MSPLSVSTLSFHESALTNLVVSNSPSC